MRSFTLPQNHNVHFISHFEKMEDPRRINKGNLKYSINEILFLVISAVISGADGWTSIASFGETKLKWLKKYFPYNNGVPSHDVLGSVFARLDSKSFSKCFTQWVDSIAKISEGEVVAVDGKTMKGSGKNSNSPLHMVSAFASQNNICLGQEAVASKSNEITAIPKLLDMLMLKGAIVTIDAMGCQKTIASDIIGKKADYILALKLNQRNLRTQVEQIFDKNTTLLHNQSFDAGHGRVETRKCEVVEDLTLLEGKKDWEGIKSIAKITSERFNKKTGKQSIESRYYITSIKGNAQKINESVRAHWSVENNLHWNLDVIFKEDNSLKKNGESPMNFNIISKIALTLLDREKTKKKSKNGKRLIAALDDKYRAKVLGV